MKLITITLRNARTNDTRYKIAAETYKGQLDGHPRTGEGQFWHKLRYPNQGWLDGVYMGDVFYTQYVRDFQPNNDTAWGTVFPMRCGDVAYTSHSRHCIPGNSDV